MSDKKRILAMDDDEGMRGSLKELLPFYGYDVEVCEKGEDVIARIEAGDSFDIFLFDINNPAMGGIETIKELLKIIPEAMVFAMSGDKFLNFKSFGFCAFWSKATGVKALLEAFKKAGA